MRVLVIGANGFIASAIIAKLLEAGHEVVGCASKKLDDSVRFVRTFKADFLKNTDRAFWRKHLHDIDVVINTVGVFQVKSEQQMYQIHRDTPQQIFEACVQAGVKKIIQFSALGIDQSDTPYAQSKLAAERILHGLPIDSCVIRPSFVYGKDCFGGSAFFRGLASVPFILPLPGKADQLLQPIHIDDLANIVLSVMGLAGKQQLVAVGKEQVSLKQLLLLFRRWLKLGKAMPFCIPSWTIAASAKVGDLWRNSPISTTGVKLSSMPNVATAEQFDELVETVGFTPRGIGRGLACMPSGVQDRWHARLFFLKPLLRFCIGLLWIVTGAVSLVNTTESFALLEQIGVNGMGSLIALYGASFIDIVLGIMTVCRYRLWAVGGLQSLLIVGYTLILTLYSPNVWLNPLGAVLKNIPILVATWVMMVLEKNR